MIKETPEIANLTERIAKDPKSKLFVPLAEEYKKAGDLEMAIHVLLEGLQHNPGYVTARSFLGKLLLAKGDLDGAQKEFEEVVQAMPDNLMARRSLGDLLIHQNRPHDALPYYKIALSQNPRDEELAALISSIEEGRDVRPRIPLSRTQSSAEQTVKGDPLASTAVPDPATAVDTRRAPNVEQQRPAETAAEAQLAVTPPVAEASHAPAELKTEVEEAEEVLVVEPLDSGPFALEPEMPEAVVSENQAPATPVASVREEDSFTADVFAQSHGDAEAVLKEGVPAEADLFPAMDEEKNPPGLFDEPIAGESPAAGAGDDFFEQAPGSALADVAEKSDDFTTDTLAELYIAQGFYEKAIEIYERMLSDKPNSRGLQEKLAGVRAYAAQSMEPAAEEKKGTDAVEPEAREYFPAVSSSIVPEEPSVFDEPKEYLPQQEAAEEGFQPAAFAEAREYVPPIESDEIILEAEVESEAGEFTPGEPFRKVNVISDFGEYIPVMEEAEQLPTGGGAAFETLVNAPVQESTQTKSRDRDFEPREYLPPNAVREPLKPAGVSAKPARAESPAGRKETIARLETWLSNIKKEK